MGINDSLVGLVECGVGNIVPTFYINIYGTTSYYLSEWNMGKNITTTDQKE